MVKKAICLLSGGLDCVVAMSKFINDYKIHAITFDYGQKASKMEIESSKEICKKVGASHTVIDLKWLGDISKSSLTSNKKIPSLNINDLNNLDKCYESAEAVWVPGRNLLFTAIAISFAEAENCEKIIVGFNMEEGETFPDNSKEFLNKFNELISVGSNEKIAIESAVIDLDKKDIVKLAHKLNSPIELSYSCYEGGMNHCGICESCIRRKRAFKMSKINDPTIYEN